ncbi:MAG: DNA polymerase III subunit gamma/tau [Cyanobacteria bacterium P01_F01_bin.33]
MPYEPLHHKYRPQRFAEIVGQTAVVRALSNAIRSDRIAPAYLFCGPRGTGKTSSARILAKSLNCESGPTIDPCQHCLSCSSITAGTSLDVIEIDAASNTGVDNIRELIERSQFAPASSRFKVYVLDEVHMLSTAAFNALLKTLEEPPPRVLFVLATTDPQRVLPTVISRCQRFDFRRIPLEAMVDHLTDIAWKENVNITTPALELIAQIAQGGLRDAESLLDQLSLLGTEVDVEAVWDLVGAVPERDLLALLDAIASGDRPQVVSLIRHLLDSGKEPLTLLDNLTGFYRDLLLAKTAPERRELAALTQPTWEALIGRAAAFTLGDIHAIHRCLLEAQPLLRHTTQPRLWLEVSLLDLLAPAAAQPVAVTSQPATVPTRSPAPPASAPAPAASVPEATSAPTPPPLSVSPTSPPRLSTAPQAPLAASPVPAAVSPPVTPAGGAPIAGKSLSTCWGEVLNRLSPVTKARCRLGHVHSETESEIAIAFPTLGFADNARQRSQDIVPVVEELLGRKVKLNFIAGAPAAEAPPAATPAASEPVESPGESSNLDRVQATSAPPPSPSPTIPQQTTPAPQSVAEPDTLNRAARQLADFFSGSIVESTEPTSEEETAPIPETELPPPLPIATSVRSKDPGAVVSPPNQPDPEEEELPF